MTVEELASEAVDCGLKVHQLLGPGLLESAYEKVLAYRLQERGLSIATQVPVPIVLDGIVIDQGFRADLIIEGKLLVEVKSVERLLEVHTMQVMTYLRFMNISLGLLMNFSGEKFSHGDISGSRLRLHQ
jgi:GxxExxY protein